MAGQTLSEIRSLLAAGGLAPRHRLGQNFLIDLNLMRKLVTVAGVAPGDVVLEVGPGTGSLSEMLLETGARLIAVELDRGLFALLSDRLGDHPRCTLIRGDALAGKHHVNPLVLDVLREQAPDAGGSRKLVANLPYQIATPLLLDLLCVRPRLASLTCTIQREVADRLAAAPGTSAYGAASVFCQSFAELTTHATLPPSVFWPRPKVESVMLRLVPRPAEPIPGDPGGFSRFLQGVFAQRRKMLRRIARAQGWAGAETAFERVGVSPDARPEDLSPAQWRILHRELFADRPPPAAGVSR